MVGASCHSDIFIFALLCCLTLGSHASPHDEILKAMKAINSHLPIEYTIVVDKFSPLLLVDANNADKMSSNPNRFGSLVAATVSAIRKFDEPLCIDNQKLNAGDLTTLKKDKTKTTHIVFESAVQDGHSAVVDVVFEMFATRLNDEDLLKWRDNLDIGVYIETHPSHKFVLYIVYFDAEILRIEKENRETAKADLVEENKLRLRNLSENTKNRMAATIMEMVLVCDANAPLQLLEAYKESNHRFYNAVAAKVAKVRSFQEVLVIDKKNLTETEFGKLQNDATSNVANYIILSSNESSGSDTVVDTIQKISAGPNETMFRKWRREVRLGLFLQSKGNNRFIWHLIYYHEKKAITLVQENKLY